MSVTGAHAAAGSLWSIGVIRSVLTERHGAPKQGSEGAPDAWLEVEILATEAWAELGVVPRPAAVAVRERAGFDVAEIDAREQVTEHDVAAFVDVVQASVGQPEGAWVHYGLTSSDVVDTALALQMTRALDVIEPAAAALESAIAARAREFRDTPMVGQPASMARFRYCRSAVLTET